jgi:hypothetical protein
MTDSQFTLQLHYDQVAWLMVTLRIPPLLGMPAALYPERQEALERLAAGRDTLQEAGIIALREEKIQVDLAVSGTLSACARAVHAIIRATRQAGDTTSSLTTYYFSPELAVRHHYDTDTLLHTFTVTTSWKQMVEQCVYDVAPAGFSELPVTPLLLHVDTFTSISETDMPDIYTLLQNADIPYEQVNTLTTAFKHYDSQHSLALLGFQTSENSRLPLGNITLALFIWDSQGMCVNAQNPTTVRLRPYSAAHLEHEIAARLGLMENAT